MNDLNDAVTNLRIDQNNLNTECNYLKDELKEIKNNIDKIKNSIETLNDKVGWHDKYFYVAITLAAIIGISGSFLLNFISKTNEDLEKINRETKKINQELNDIKVVINKELQLQLAEAKKEFKIYTSEIIEKTNTNLANVNNKADGLDNRVNIIAVKLDELSDGVTQANIIIQNIIDENKSLLIKNNKLIHQIKNCRLEPQIITNIDYIKYTNETGILPPVILTENNEPVLNISWYDAKKYCEIHNKRLMTEEEWRNIICYIKKQPDESYLYEWTATDAIDDQAVICTNSDIGAEKKCNALASKSQFLDYVAFRCVP